MVSRYRHVMQRVVVIGAGPAGSAAAAGLARRGFDVTIVEARRFPRAKVCGEFISPTATGLLESLVGTGALDRAGAHRVRTLVIEHDDREVTWPLPTPAWALSRASLDQLLLDRAASLGAYVLQPCRVAGVGYDESGAVVGLADGRSLHADLVIHADGSGRFDAGSRRSTPCRRAVVARKCHLRVPHGIDGVRMRAAHGAYVGTVQVEHGLSTCALVARKDLVAAHRSDEDAMLASLWPGYDPSWRVGEWLACGVPASGYIRPGHLRSLRVGNAAAAVEPVGGEGIGLALWAGATLADLLAEVPRDSTVAALQSVQASLGRLYRARLRVRLPACRLAGAALMRPSIVRMAWPTLGAPNLTIRPWYALTGKPLAVAP